ncbi:hypothetical protein NEF87_001674 [Candidatus Lokiarchaeum ossiferum]|uniref:Uncharacterized protein n=1 Tax=Candidatus Lokiarchaeum ossiferum TaxID=2951803 RepID=A0ABY6HSE6_9ARCH|nr:hypothetical protein NEF87_001674 [Candidatus Lokiarchaeum sp. B-35]
MVDEISAKNYEDFVTKKPQLIRRISLKQEELLREHVLIMKSLTKYGHMTVKEIHHLYYNPQTQKYSKALKTIYRYMEFLEKSSLIQVSGHRMAQKSRMAEKLYCRTAVVFLFEENLDKKNWWDSSSGADFMKIVPEYMQRFFQVEKSSIEPLTQLIETYLSGESKNIQDQFEAIESDKTLADLASPLSVWHLKEMFSITAIFKLFIENSDFRSQLNSIFQKK